MAGPCEVAFETAICESLASASGYTAVKTGNSADRHAASGDDGLSADLEQKVRYVEDAIVKTVAGFANSPWLHAVGRCDGQG